MNAGAIDEGESANCHQGNRVASSTVSAGSWLSSPEPQRPWLVFVVEIFLL